MITLTPNTNSKVCSHCGCRFNSDNESEVYCDNCTETFDEIVYRIERFKKELHISEVNYV